MSSDLKAWAASVVLLADSLKEEFWETIMSSDKWLAIYSSTPQGSNVEAKVTENVLRLTTTFSDWINVYKGVGDDRGLKMIAADRLTELAQTFADWYEIHEAAPNESALKGQARQKCLELAQTFVEWDSVRVFSGCGPLGFKNMSMVASTYPEWKRLLTLLRGNESYRNVETGKNPLREMKRLASTSAQWVDVYQQSKLPPHGSNITLLRETLRKQLDFEDCLGLLPTITSWPYRYGDVFGRYKRDKRVFGMVVGKLARTLHTFEEWRTLGGHLPGDNWIPHELRLVAATKMAPHALTFIAWYQVCTMAPSLRFDANIEQTPGRKLVSVDNRSLIERTYRLKLKALTKMAELASTDQERDLLKEQEKFHLSLCAPATFSYVSGVKDPSHFGIEFEKYLRLRVHGRPILSKRKRGRPRKIRS